jgi:phosphatidylethanolamine/phosphatidyl-N-methylethanolamine N-methyltransferase
MTASPRASALSRTQETALFFRAWLKAPLQIAALTPSSATTGQTMAHLVERDRPGMILELGSGTGPIGDALLASGLPPERIIMVEREPDLVRHLRQRFPGVRILDDDATCIGDALAKLGVTQLATVVSTLPIVWFPLEAQAAILSQCMALLGPDAPFLQLTNQPASPIPAGKLGLRAERAAHVWKNLPPSFIWRYRRGN